MTYPREMRIVRLRPRVLTVLGVVRGPAGADGADLSEIDRTAGAVLSAPRVVKATFNNQVVYPNLAVPADKDLVLGLNLVSAGIGTTVGIRFGGMASDPSWSFELGPVWCGPAGALVQAPPDEGWTLRVATAISPTTLLIAIDREGAAGDPIDPGDIAQYFLNSLNS